MITLNGARFAETEGEITDSLFTEGGTCVGKAKRNLRSINFYDFSENLLGVLNNHGVLCCATKLDAGGYWYSLADVPRIGRWESNRAQREELEALELGWDTVNGTAKRRYKARNDG